MSYTTIPPAFYAPLQPNTTFHVGAPGWLKANVPPWGQNPNNAWPAVQAANGLGAAAAPERPFYVGKVPFSWYIQQGIAPWGRFSSGPAYASPRPLACRGCVGMPVRPGIGSIVEASRAINAGNMQAAVAAIRQPSMMGLAGGCGPCQITDGERCLPCPNGSELDECSGCVDGYPTSTAKWYEHPLAGPIAVSVATAVATGIVLALIKSKTRIPVA